MSAAEPESGIVERFVAAWVDGDLAAVMACVTDDIVFSPSGSGGPVAGFHGRDAVRAAFAERVGDDPGLALGAPVGLGDRVLGEWSYPAAADGTVLRGVDVYTLRDGLIAAKDVYSKRSTTA